MKKLIFVSLICLAFAATASAAEWNFYGNARMATWYTSTDLGDRLDQATGTTTKNFLVNGDDDDQEIQWDLQSNSRIGAKVKHGTISGYFEYGTSSGNANIRHIYGTWDFGAGKLLIGQTWTPTTLFYSGQAFNVDDGLGLVGQPNISRKPQVALHFGGGWGNVKLAVVQINDANNDIDDITGLTTNVFKDDGTVNPVSTPRYSVETDYDEMLPRLEASYGYKGSMWFVDVIAGYQVYENDDGISTNNVTGQVGKFDDNIDSYYLGLGGGVNFGAFYAKAYIWGAQNAAQYGLSLIGNHSLQYKERGDGGLEIDDTDSVGGLLVAGYKFNDRFSIEAGGAMSKADAGPSNDVFGNTMDEDKTAAIYVQVPITIADGLFLIPELGYYDYDEDMLETEEGEEFYAGAKWQINF